MMDKNTNQNEHIEESTLFGAPTSAETIGKRRKKSAIKRQRTAIIVIAAAIAAALPLYFFVVKPIVEYVEEQPEENIELLDGEVLAAGNRILMYEHYERADIEKIEVHNEHGEYSFYYDKKYDEFYITDHPLAPYDSEVFASLVVNTGYTLVDERVHTACEDMSEYGLDGSQSPAYYTLTTRDGDSHTVYLGNLTASGAGYYARVEGRDAVYIVGSDIADTVLASIEELVTPQLTYLAGTNASYFIEDFAIMDGKDSRVIITHLDETEKADAALTTSYAMLAPANYSVNTTNYSAVLEQLGNFTGSRTIAVGPSEETRAEYGLVESAHTVYFTYKGAEQIVFFSEKNENGDYYAYSPLFDLIAEVDAESAEWIGWDLIKWVDFPIFLMNINDVKTITVDSDAINCVFDIDGEAKQIVVTERGSGFKPDVENFRQFYKVLLSTYVQGYIADDLTDEEVAALIADEPYLTLTVETDAGKTTVYKYYPYSTRRAYYTVNGEGIFYAMRDMVTKIITDCEKVMTDTAIDASAKS